VTVSVAVVIAAAMDTAMTNERLLRLAEQAVHRAKHAGRNRVEKVDVSSTTLSVLAAARCLGISQDQVLDLLHSGRLTASEQDRSLRFNRVEIESYRQSQLKNQKSEMI
jgi:hypothetical protein